MKKDTYCNKTKTLLFSSIVLPEYQTEVKGRWYISRVCSVHHVDVRREIVQRCIWHLASPPFPNQLVPPLHFIRPIFFIAFRFQILEI